MKKQNNKSKIRSFSCDGTLLISRIARAEKDINKRLSAQLKAGVAIDEAVKLAQDDLLQAIHNVIDASYVKVVDCS